MPKQRLSLQNTRGNLPWYEKLKEKYPNAVYVSSYVPVLGSIIDGLDAINTPNMNTIGNATVSIGSDILGYRLLKSLAKSIKATKGRRMAQELIDRNNIRMGRTSIPKGRVLPSTSMLAKEQAGEAVYPFAELINFFTNSAINYNTQDYKGYNNLDDWLKYTNK